MELLLSEDIENVASAEVDLNDLDLVELQKTANEMIQFAMENEGVGLSGCQVDDFRKFFVWNQGRWNAQDLANYREEQMMRQEKDRDVYWKEITTSGPPSLWKVVINPTYLPEKGGQTVTAESCLSYPDRSFVLKRYRKVWVKYWTIEKGKLVKKTRTLSGYPAVIFQHETDHCNGITIAMRGIEVDRKTGKPINSEVKENGEAEKQLEPAIAE